MSEEEEFRRMIEAVEADPVGRLYKELGGDVFGAPDIRSALAATNPDDRAFLALVMCGAEIDNGGFEQLFSNSSNDIARHGVEGAERFGLHEHARVIRDAWDRWVQLTGRVLEERDRRLSELDENWYDLGEDLSARLLDFAQQRQSDA